MTDNIARKRETGLRGVSRRNSEQEECSGDLPALELTGFGQLDFDPQFDLGQDRVEARVA